MEHNHVHERRFSGDADRLRSPERIKRLEVSNVVTLSLQGLPDAGVLDVGTGTGLFAEAFIAAGSAVTGIDTNPDLLALARRHVPTAEEIATLKGAAIADKLRERRLEKIRAITR